MLASLAFVDKGLANILVERAFATDIGESSKSIPSSACSPEIKAKVVATLSECRRVLEEEPPQRFSDYWGTPSANNEFKALIRKLRKCRDPDRANLVVFQANRREQVLGTKKAAGSHADGVFGGPLC